MSSPSAYLTALARATSAMRFGVMIYQLPFHHPIRLAEEVAMLDHLSRGRVEFGAGAGVSYYEFLRWNVDFAQRRAISEEALDIILMAWKEGSVTYEGKFFKFDEFLTTPDTLQKPHPPSATTSSARGACSATSTPTRPGDQSGGSPRR